MKLNTQALETGVLYVASGQDFVDLAVQSARSLRQFEPDLAVDLVTDQHVTVPSGLFTQISRQVDMHVREKLRAMQVSRFERTLFVDSDTVFVAPLGDLFDILDRFECALAHDVRRRWDLIQEGDRHETPYAFPQHNSGVFLYRKSPAMQAFLKEWCDRFFASDDIQRDQIILKDLLWESDLRYYVLPPEFNLRRVTVLDAWEPLDGLPTILHSHRFKDHLTDPSSRIATLEALLKAERAALAQEWQDESDPEIEAWRVLRHASSS